MVHAQRRPRPAWLWVLAALWLAGCGGRDQPGLPWLGEDAVILAFGDSLTAGTGAQSDQSYPAVLETLSARTVVNAGVPGDSLSAMRANLAAMIELVQARGLPLVLIAVPEPALIGLDAPPQYASLADEYDLVLIKDVMADVLSQSRLRSDRIHPNAAGYRQVAEQIAAVLEQTGAL